MSKSAVVFGATSGIGFHVAKELAINGFHVYALGRRVEKMTELAEKYNVTTIKCDVCDPAQTEAVVKKVAEENEGALDVLYLNAGKVNCYPCADMDMDALKQLYEVNFFSQVRITKEFLPLMIKAKGTIFYLGSIFGEIANVTTAGYCLSKAALRQYANCLDMEMRPFGVKVVHFTIGAVNTDFAPNAGVEAKDAVNENDLFYIKELGCSLGEYITKRIYTDPTGVMTPDTFAKSVIKDFLNPNPPFQLYRGSYSLKLSWLNALLPRLRFLNAIWKKYDWLSIVEKVKQKLGYA